MTFRLIVKRDIGKKGKICSKLRKFKRIVFKNYMTDFVNFAICDPVEC